MQEAAGCYRLEVPFFCEKTTSGWSQLAAGCNGILKTLRSWPQKDIESPPELGIVRNVVTLGLGQAWINHIYNHLYEPDRYFFFAGYARLGKVAMNHHEPLEVVEIEQPTLAESKTVLNLDCPSF